MMTEAEMKAELRLVALEYVVSNLAKQVYRLAGANAEAIRIVHRGAIDGLETKTFPDMSPEMSDMAAGELQDAVRRLLSLIEQTAAADYRPTDR